MKKAVASTGPAVLVLGLGTLVSHGFGLSLVPAMLPRIEEEFQSGYGALGIAVATGLIAYALGSSIASQAMRRVPTRALLVSTFVVTGAGLVVSALAPSPAFISIAVVLLGISAPVSWTATMHTARETVASDSLSLVSAGASGGAAVGVVANGVLVQTSGSMHSWRVSFIIAAVIAAGVVVATLIVFRAPIASPESSGVNVFKLFGVVLSDPSGRLLVTTSAISGVAVFTLSTYLTATALDEFGVGDTAAAALLWVGGLSGVAAAFALGRYADRRTPASAMAVGMGAYALTLAILVMGWAYWLLLLAMVGYGLLNGPVWGLMGASANRRFDAERAVATVSLGLIAASLFGAATNTMTGLWIDSSGSSRVPFAFLAVLTVFNTVYLLATRRRERAEAGLAKGTADV